MWYQLWQSDHVTYAACELHRLITSSAAADQFNIGLSEGDFTTTAVRKAEPVSSPAATKTTFPATSPAAPTSSSNTASAPVVAIATAADKDLTKAWLCIEKCDNPALKDHLKDLGINAPEFLLELDNEELNTIADFLPKIPKRTFMKAMCL